MQTFVNALQEHFIERTSPDSCHSEKGALGDSRTHWKNRSPSLSVRQESGVISQRSTEHSKIYRQIGPEQMIVRRDIRSKRFDEGNH